MDAVRLVAGSSNRSLAEKIAKRMGINVASCIIKKHSDGEIFPRVQDSLRGKDVFIIQSTSAPVNDNLMELLLLIDAVKRSSAQQISVVLPYYGYARQSKRKKDARVPIGAKLVADLIAVTGASRVVTMELHSMQVQGFFDIPLDNLRFSDVLCTSLRQEYRDLFPDEAYPGALRTSSLSLSTQGTNDSVVIVAAGKRATSRAKYMAETLRCRFAVLDGRKLMDEDEDMPTEGNTTLDTLDDGTNGKAYSAPATVVNARRSSGSVVSGGSNPLGLVAPNNALNNFYVLGEVSGRTCIVVDDIIDRAKSLCEGFEVLRIHGARRIILAAVHAVLAEEGVQRLLSSCVERIFCSDSIECADLVARFGQHRLTILSSAELFAEAIRRVHFQEMLD
eukprot:c21393_g1_i1.p1 GENE.c21393_g1_i1~~c21393_g1_i1.p1  ORF type:complete len:404 (-),score=114.80 c21393_g1_i1:36-1211(-)